MFSRESAGQQGGSAIGWGRCRVCGRASVRQRKNPRRTHFARAVPAIGGNGEHAFAVFGDLVAAVPMPPIMPDHNGGVVLIVVPPRIADGKTPAPACEKGFAGDFFYAAGERADGVAAAAVDVVGGGGAQHGGVLGGVFQDVGVVVLLGKVVVVPRGVFDAAVQLVVPFLDELDERRGVVLQLGDGFRQPCGVNDAQVGAL